ncbi:hypothetical protein ACIBBG_29790 [Micromonospora chersina]|uniref:hypothetical protein n=1 Tax=Micromonospora chersina TaxID=47854 RepID=UPI00378FDB8C
MFEEDDWRILWWELFLRVTRSADFPTEPEDIDWAAFAGESAIRHFCVVVIRQMSPLIEKALGSAYSETADPEVVELLRNFAWEMRNPALAADFEVGPWSRPDDMDEDAHLSKFRGRETPRLDALVQRAADLASRRLWVEWREYGAIKWQDDWVSRFGHTRSRLPGLMDHIGFANFDLRAAGLPAIAFDDAGQPYVDLPHPGLKDAVLEVVQRHGFADL